MELPQHHSSWNQLHPDCTKHLKYHPQNVQRNPPAGDEDQGGSEG
jgi:hypothetical protein